MMEFLVDEFPSLSSLKHLVPPRQTLHPCRKATVAPMEILFKDEKYKAETIDILTQLTEDAKLKGNSQVLIKVSLI